MGRLTQREREPGRSATRDVTIDVTLFSELVPPWRVPRRGSSGSITPVTPVQDPYACSLPILLVFWYTSNLVKSCFDATYGRAAVRERALHVVRRGDCCS